MIDLVRAVSGYRCPWCEDRGKGPWERFLDRLPPAVFKFYLFDLDGLYVWRLGRKWHNERHEEVA